MSEDLTPAEQRLEQVLHNVLRGGSTARMIYIAGMKRRVACVADLLAALQAAGLGVTGNCKSCEHREWSCCATGKHGIQACDKWEPKGTEHG